jgi:hypothetical protein
MMAIVADVTFGKQVEMRRREVVERRALSSVEGPAV